MKHQKFPSELNSNKKTSKIHTEQISDIFEAISRGCLQCLQIILQKFPTINLDSPCNKDGLYPIHVATLHGHIHILRFLVNEGASVNVRDVHGGTPLHHAALNGKERAIRWLLRHNATINLDKWGRSPLEVAIEQQNYHIVNLLRSRIFPSGSSPVYEISCEESRRATNATASKTNAACCVTEGTIRKEESQLGGEFSSSSGNSSLGSSGGLLVTTPSPTSSFSDSSTIGSSQSTQIISFHGDLTHPEEKSTKSFYLHTPPSTIRSKEPQPFYLHSSSQKLVEDKVEIIEEDRKRMGPPSPITGASTLTSSETSLAISNSLISSDSCSSVAVANNSVPTLRNPLPAIPRSQQTAEIESFKNLQTMSNGQQAHFLPPPPPPPMPQLSTTVENEYEDIDDMEDGSSPTEGRKLYLNRAISVPLEKREPKGVPIGTKRPFIPPNFPNPPNDTLIKPSEYLKSINKGKISTISVNNTSPCSIPNQSMKQPSKKIDDVIKKLQGVEMNTLSEEDDHHLEEESHKLEEHEIDRKHLNKEDNIKIEIKSPKKFPMLRTLSAPPKIPSVNSKAAIIAELTESSQLGGVKEWKEELKRREIEEAKEVNKQLASLYSPLKFVDEIPEKDENGGIIPEWKRQMLARKVAERAKKEAEEQLRAEAEAKRISSIPNWKRELLQRTSEKNAQ